VSPPSPSWAAAALANAADENLAVHASWVTRHLAGARVEVSPDLILVDSGLSCDTFNVVCRARLTATTAASRVHDVLAFFGQTGHPFSWWLGPGFTPDQLPAILVDSGLEPVETEDAMALDLGLLPDAPPRPSDFEIRRIRTAADLKAFAAIAAANWTPPDHHVIEYYQRAAPVLLQPDVPLHLYLGLLAGEPVATAELTIGGGDSGDGAGTGGGGGGGAGVVGVYNVSTSVAARHRGIGSLMTWWPLSEARAAGHRAAILQASSAGVHVYQRLGFATIGTITEYKPVGPPLAA
jgi:hypothetical protein